MKLASLIVEELELLSDCRMKCRICGAVYGNPTFAAKHIEAEYKRVFALMRAWILSRPRKRTEGA